MRRVSPRKRPSKSEPLSRQRLSSRRSLVQPGRLAQELLFTVAEMRYELAELDQYLGDLEAQAKRVRRLRPEQ